MKALINLVRSSDIYSRIFTGAFWSVLGTVVAKAIVLAAGIFCANIIGKKDFGELGLIRSSISTFVIFGTAGMGVTATRFIAQSRINNLEKVGKIYAVTSLFTTVSAAIIAAVVIIFSDGIASLIGGQELSIPLKFGGLILMSAIMNSCYQGALSGYEAFKQIAINTFLSSMIEAVSIVVGAAVAGMTGALVGYGIGITSLMLFNVCSARKLLVRDGIRHPYCNLELCDFKVIYQFSIPAAISSFLVTPSYFIARAILAKFAGYGEVGMYEAADQWRAIILFVPSAMCNIVLPILSGSVSSNSSSSFVKALKMNLLLNVLFASAAALFVILFRRAILQAYGDGFDSAITLSFLAISTIFSSFASVVGVSITSLGKVWQGMCFNVVWAVLFVGLTYYFVKCGMGASGIALALLFSYLVHSVYQLVYLIYIVRHSVRK